MSVLKRWNGVNWETIGPAIHRTNTVNIYGGDNIEINLYSRDDTVYSGEGEVEPKYINGFCVEKEEVPNAAIGDYIIGMYSTPSSSTLKAFLINIDDPVYWVGTKLIDVPMIDADGKVTGIINGSITKEKLDANLQETIEEIDQLKNKMNTITLGINNDDGLIYIYINGVKQGTGIAINNITTEN